VAKKKGQQQNISSDKIISLNDVADDLLRTLIMQSTDFGLSVHAWRYLIGSSNYFLACYIQNGPEKNCTSLMHRHFATVCNI